jgi:hypothetical protein
LACAGSIALWISFSGQALALYEQTIPSVKEMQAPLSFVRSTKVHGKKLLPFPEVCFENRPAHF